MTPSPRSEPCRCAGAKARAVAVEQDIKQENLKHLRRIHGQVGGLLRMVEDERYCADIITQVSAVRESLNAVARNLMRNHLRNCAPQAFEQQGEERDRMVNELLDLCGKLSR